MLGAAGDGGIAVTNDEEIADYSDNITFELKQVSKRERSKTETIRSRRGDSCY